MAVTFRSLSQRNSRRSSARRIPSLARPAKRASIVSSTTRFAPMLSIAAPSRTKRPSRSYSPVSSISLRSTRTWSIASFPVRTNRETWKPKEATLAASSSAVSSKDMNTPGSWNLVMPRMRNSMARSVLPAPAGPQTSVGRPRGSPPSVISSSPWMPVGHFDQRSSGSEVLSWTVPSWGEPAIRCRGQCPSFQYLGIEDPQTLAKSSLANSLAGIDGPGREQ
jgi:hypothetical protein